MRQVFGPNELLEDVITKELCIGCGACVNLCPYFKSYKGKTAMLFPCTLTQGRCYAYCPKAEVDLDELSLNQLGRRYEGSPLGTYQHVMAARAGEKVGNGPFQAGGTVTALMGFALKTGRIQAAVLTGRQGMIPRPRLITRHQEVVSCATSKFTAAPTLAALNRAIRDGYSNIGVVGTPCQVMSMAQMRANPMQDPDFKDPLALVVGLFCTWALDTRRLAAHVSRYVDIPRIQAMDIPPPPSEVLVVHTRGEIIQIPLDEIRPLIPLSCHVCTDMTSEWADISVGVLEGSPQWNTVIVRTEKGQQLVDDACKQGYLLKEETRDQQLEHLCSAAANKKKRALARAQDEGMLNQAQGEKRSTLRIRPEVFQAIMGQEDAVSCQC